MGEVRRVYVEKKKDYAVKAKELHASLKQYLGLDVESVRVLVRYDIENLSDASYEKALVTVFSEPPVDDVYEETLPLADGEISFSVEFLPGQFDQRADSAQQCVKLLNEDEDALIRSATTYVVKGDLTDEQLEAVKEYCINPVDSREAAADKPETLVMDFEEPADVKILDGFKDMEEDKFKELYDSLNLAMTFKDFLHGHQFAYFNIHPICFQLRIGTFGDLDPHEIHFGNHLILCKLSAIPYFLYVPANVHIRSEFLHDIPYFHQ